MVGLQEIRAESGTRGIIATTDLRVQVAELLQQRVQHGRHVWIAELDVFVDRRVL